MMTIFHAMQLVKQIAIYISSYQVEIQSTVTKRISLVLRLCFFKHIRKAFEIAYYSKVNCNTCIRDQVSNSYETLQVTACEALCLHINACKSLLNAVPVKLYNTKFAALLTNHHT